MQALRHFLIGTGAIALLAAATAASAQPRVVRSVPIPPGGVYELVFNPADRDLYVAAVGSMDGANATIVRIDGRTLRIERTIALPGQPAFGLGLNRRTGILYGTDTMGGAVTAVDLAGGRVLARIGGGNAHLREAIVDEAANRVFASVVGSPARGEPPATPSQIWIIDGATNRIARTIDVETGALTGIAHDPAGNRIFGTGTMSNEIAVVDLADGRTSARWPTGSQRPTNIAYDPAGNRLFVASQGSGDLTVMDSRDGRVIARVATGAGALSVAFNPRNQQVYVANREAGTVSVVDARTYALVVSLATGTHPQTIAIDPRSNAVYVTNKRRMRPRGATADAPIPDDPNGDTLTLIRP